MSSVPDLTPPQPLPLRGLNGLGGMLHRLGLPLGTLDEAKLLARAARRTGLADYGDPGFRQGLGVLLDSLERDAALHPVGRILASGVITKALQNRLLFVQAARERPQALEEPLRRPVVIVSMPRTGSTLLQRLLCEDPEAMFLPMWLLMEPMPPPGPRTWGRGGGARLRRARMQLALQDLLAPSIKVRHEVAPEAPEEDTFLFMSSFVSLEYWAILPVHGYARWLVQQPAAPAYRFFRQHLQLLQHDLPGTHWVLKSPMHFIAFEALLEALPEAGVVLLHRDPRQVVPSMHSLFRAVHQAASDAPDVARAVRFNTAILQEAAERMVSLRDGPHSDRILDVGYRELVADPVGVARRVRERFGLGWHEDLDRAMHAWRARSPQHKHGRHRYTPEDFGQRAADIEAKFRSYRERFGAFWL